MYLVMMHVPFQHQIYNVNPCSVYMVESLQVKLHVISMHIEYFPFMALKMISIFVNLVAMVIVGKY